MKRSIFLLLLASLLLPSCGNQQKEELRNDRVVVSILPLKYFIDEISSSQLDVTVMVPPGVCPETFEPTISQLMDLSRSRLFFQIGLLDFENTLFTSFPELTDSTETVDLSTGIDLILGHRHHHDHSAHCQDPNQAAGVDPHIWLSPRRVKKMIETISEQLIANYPSKKEQYRNNTETLVAKVDSVDFVLRDAIGSLPKQHYLIYHPVLTYFAEDYGLEQIAVEEEGKEPSAAHMAKVLHLARNQRLDWILFQEQINGEIVRILAKESGLKPMPIDPLSYDWFQNMNHLLEIMKQVLVNNDHSDLVCF